MRILTPALALSLAAAGLVVVSGYRTAGGVEMACPPEPGSPVPVQQQLEFARTKPTRSPGTFAALLASYDARPDPAMHAALDAAAGQRDAAWSRLYWHTDLASAQAQARAEHKPILYLRMLGKLTDEYSCANSRFFRTVLYANTEVSKLLRDRFVLVWESERPVPVLTVDYGDGRVLKRTITGNSAHYVLDADGRVVDVLPGLFDPATFSAIVTAAGEAAARNTEEARREHLQAAELALAKDWARETGAFSTGSRPASAEAARRASLRSGRSGNEADATRTSRVAITKDVVEAPAISAISPAYLLPAALATPLVVSVNAAPEQVVAADAPPAAVAAPLAPSKAVVERPLVRAVTPADVSSDTGDTADIALWQWLAVAHNSRPETRLDAHSIGLMRSQWGEERADKEPDAFARTVDRFQQTIAQDTVRNNFRFRRQALAWLRESGTGVSLETLNTRIYSELFLTPRSDPWLGLVPQDTYSALCDDGCVISDK